MKLHLSFDKCLNTSVVLCSFVAVMFLVGCGGHESHDATAASTQELERLREENKEVQRLRAENQQLPQLRKDNAEVQRLRASQDELARLKKENEELRIQIAQLQPTNRPPQLLRPRPTQP
ncbi:MAG: hypothetical protein FJ403_14315 [Verrucomicrobia bacterium]|nr:hypothetical protein [Verrucomicrobiota bacterium]